MNRARIPSATEIRRLLLFLLGRQPSDRALAELGQRPLGVSVDLVLFGTEFEDVVRRGVIGRQTLPHHRHAYAPTAPELAWFSEAVGLSPEGGKALGQTRDWLGLLAVLMRDAGLASRLRTEYGDHPRLKTMEAIARAVVAACPSTEAAASLSLPRVVSSPAKPVAASAAKPVTPQAAKAVAVPTAQPVASTAAKPPAAPGVVPGKAPKSRPAGAVTPQPAATPLKPVPHISGPALDVVAAQAAWKRLLADPGHPRLRGELYGAFRNNEKLILFLNAQLDEVPPGHCAPFESLIRLLAARLFLRLFMSRSALRAAQAAEAADAAAPAGLQDTDRNRLAKTMAIAALRSGKVEDATRVLRRLTRDNPLDWEAQMALADVLSSSNPRMAADLYSIAMHLNPDLGSAGRLSVAEFSYSSGDRIGARKIVLDMMRAEMAVPECHLALGNMALSEADPDAWRARACRFFELQSLTAPAFGTAESADNLFGIGNSDLPRLRDNPLISVVTTAFNAAETIAASMRSVLEQTRGNLELFIVDDCSSDATTSIVASFAERDSRVRLLRNATNIGTYCSKNRAIREARGDFVTLHDSDDWMHPQRFEMHLSAMQIGTPAASMSNWVRMDDAGRAVLRKGGGGYIHRNPASTFIRKDVLQNIGLFDSVRVGADSELLWRMRHAFGPHAVAEIDGCLGLGLHHENSLTQSGVTAFDEFRFSPVRLEYAEAWGNWHLAQLNHGRPLHVTFPLKDRNFEAPAEIVVTNEPMEAPPEFAEELRTVA